MAVVVVVHIGVALVVVHIGVSLVVMHIGVSLVVVHIWVALVVVNWSGLWLRLRLGLGSTALLILFVVGQWVIEGRKSGLSWAVSSGPGPLILNGLGQAADDRSTLVGDG